MKNRLDLYAPNQPAFRKHITNVGILAMVFAAGTLAVTLLNKTQGSEEDLASHNW